MDLRDLSWESRARCSWRAPSTHSMEVERLAGLGGLPGLAGLERRGRLAGLSMLAGLSCLGALGGRAAGWDCFRGRKNELGEGSMVGQLLRGR